MSQVLERPGDHELVRALHRHVDVGVLGEAGEGALDAVGERVDPADVALVELHRACLVLGRVEPAVCSCSSSTLCDLVGELVAGGGSVSSAQSGMLAGAGGEDEAREAGRLRQGVLHREHRAPGRAEEVDAARGRGRRARPAPRRTKSSTVQKSVGLLDPGAAAADLVVEDDPPAGGGERLERLEVVVRRAWPAVQAEQRQLARVLAVADDAVPGLAACVRDGALGRHRGSLRPGSSRSRS